MQAFEYRGTVVPLSRHRLEGVDMVCATLPVGGTPIPVCHLHAGGPSPFLVEPGIRAVAQALTPPMRPGSLALFAALSLLSLLEPAALLLAIGYGAVRWARRTVRTRTIQCELEIHLGGGLATPAQAEEAYRSVRSLQISGNNTTSSILRR